MYRHIMKSKIHRAVVTEADLNYVGSITIDEELMEAVDIWPNEKVQVVDNNNGSRFETYVIPGPRGSGVICVNGAAARLVQPGDLVIIIAYGMLEDSHARNFKPKVILVDEQNKLAKVLEESAGDRVD